jgi:hypothetical protein
VRGGARKGAGRKATGRKVKLITLSLSPEAFEKLKSVPNKSKFVNELIMNARN